MLIVNTSVERKENNVERVACTSMCAASFCGLVGTVALTVISLTCARDSKLPFKISVGICMVSSILFIIGAILYVVQGVFQNMSRMMDNHRYHAINASAV